MNEIWIIWNVKKVDQHYFGEKTVGIKVFWNFQYGDGMLLWLRITCSQGKQELQTI